MNQGKTEITIVDSLMGTGKTSWAIQTMNAAHFSQTFEDGARFVYITPLLEELQRIKNACPALNFKEPQRVDGSKLKHFNELIACGENICATHALFNMADRRTSERLIESNYVLVVDEAVEAVKEFAIHRDDIRALFEANMVYVDPQQRLRWNHQRYPDYEGNAFDEVRALCDNGALVQVDDEFWVWEFPVEFIRLFPRVYIMSYLFEGSLLSSYLKANDMSYERRLIVEDGNGYALAAMDPGLERQRLAKLRQLITVVDDERLNSVGTPVGRENPLSSTWFEMDAKRKDRRGWKTKKLQLATYNFFRNTAKSKAADNMWSCVKEWRSKLTGNGYGSAWTPCNLRATNAYENKKNLAYLANVFMRPRLLQYFKSCGTSPNEDLYALSQLVQWIWRSQIRKKEPQPITVFIPSQRMRTLFIDWLSGENVGNRDGCREAA